MGVWDLCALNDLTDAQQNFIIFYYDRLLQTMAGHPYWKRSICHYNTPVDTVDIRKKDEDGQWITEKKVYVTVTSEAFGWLVYANNRDKWLNTFIFQRDNPRNTALPGKDHDDYHKYQPKYTESKNGQVKNGGWKPAAYTEFERFKKIILNLRAADKVQDYSNYRVALQLVRDLYNVTDAVYTTKKESAKRKRESEVSAELVIDIEELEE